MSADGNNQKTTVELIEDWQTGFFLLIGCLVVATVTTVVLSPSSPPFGVAIFFGSAILAFLVFSYVLYGR